VGLRRPERLVREARQASDALRLSDFSPRCAV